MRETNYILVDVKLAFKYMDFGKLRKIYMTKICPELEYAATVWFHHLRSHIDIMERFQGNAAKMVPA